MSATASTIFNKAWAEGSIRKPIIVLIGGYAGTGKSTLAKRFSELIDNAQIIPTGIFRSIAQAQNNVDNNPALYLSTYDLHVPYGNDNQGIRRAYSEQCVPVTDIIKSVITFLGTEKQHLIIEGNHILPWEKYYDKNCEIIELYLYVNDKDKHMKMLEGPTHNRRVGKLQFETGRYIHDMLYSEAISTQKNVFECSETDKAELYLEQKIAEIIQNEMD